MTDEEYMRKAVDLADGWEITDNYDHGVFWFAPIGDVDGFSRKDELCSLWPWVRDLIAAQLVRQIDANEFAGFKIEPNGTYVAFDDDAEGYAHGPDRTMNTIKAIVDSGVLND